MRKALRILASLFLAHFVCGWPIAEAQHYPVRIYTEADGLANTNLFDITQDSSGIIWIARRSGITSYNSVTFHNYNASDGLLGNSIAFMRVDRSNKVWALPDMGLLFVYGFREGKWEKLEKEKQSMLSESVEFSAFDLEGSGEDIVFAAGTKTEGVFVYRQGKWTNYKKGSGLKANRVLAVAFFNNELYISTQLGISVLSAKGIMRPAGPNLQEPGKLVMAMHVSGDKLWMLGEGWLGYYKDGKMVTVNRNFRFYDTRTAMRSFIFADKTNRVIFGGPLAAFYYSPETGEVESIGMRNGLVTDGGLSGMIDREGNIWIVGPRGVTKVMTLLMASYFQSDGLANNEVASVIQESPGNYIFGHAGELTFYRQGVFSKMKIVKKNFDDHVTSRIIEMKKASNGIWLAASFCGLALLDRTDHVRWFGEAQGLRGAVFSIEQASNGKLYAATTSGLYIKEGDIFRQVLIKGYREMTLRRVFRGQNGMLMLATLNDGIIEYSESAVRTFKCQENPIANNIYSVLEDDEGRCWVGTAAGIYLKEESGLISAAKYGLNINRPVYLILQDQNKVIWFGTDNGLIRWDKGKSEHLSLSDGLAGLEINRGAGLADEKGNIWFGTNNGLTIFRKGFDAEPEKSLPPVTVIDMVVVGRDTLPPASEFSLQGKNARLDFRFHAVSFKDEKKVRYRYFMEGLDTAWSKEVPYHNTSVAYINLPPGNYRFMVKACNSEGVWSQPVATAAISVDPPVFFRWWFILSILVALSLITVLIVRFTLINRYKKALEKTVRERTEALMLSEEKLRESNQAKDNFFSIIAHDLRSPFNVMLGMLELLTSDWNEYSEEQRQTMLKKVMNASSRTIDLLDNLLTWAREQRGLLPFNPAALSLSELIRENISLAEAGAAAKDIDIRVVQENDREVIADKDMLNTVIRNLLSNAIKFTFPGGLIRISLKDLEGREALVSVNDNGFGMPPERVADLFKIEKRQIVKGTANETGTGLGLILCRDFIQRNNGRIWVESEEGKGSTFYFTLPYAVNN